MVNSFNENWCGSDNVTYIHSMWNIPKIIRKYHLDCVMQNTNLRPEIYPRNWEDTRLLITF